MSSMSSLAEHLERQSVLVMESTIPAGMTIDEWRRSRTSRPRPRGRWRMAERRRRRKLDLVAAVTGA
jgi:hypothetical protein